MKKFLKKSFLFALPVCIFFSIIEYLLRNIRNDYALKAEVYKQNAEGFETLILGNSCALYGLNPVYFNTKTYNGAHLAQTFDIDDAVFHKYEPRFTKLKYVLIPVTDMSFFFKLGNSDDSWRVTNYFVYYNLYPSARISDYFEILNLPFSVNRNRLISYYIKKKSPVTITDLGFGNDYTPDSRHNLDTTAVEQTRIHRITDYKEFDHEKGSLERIVKTCIRRNIEVVLFIPPAYKGYVSMIDSLQLSRTFQACNYFKDTYKNVSYYNFLNDTSFHSDDYFDAVHLNQTGAKKMSLKMNEILEQSEKQSLTERKGFQKNEGH